MLFSCGEQSLIYTRLRGEASDDCVGGVNDGHCAGRSNTMLHDEGDHNQLSSSAVCAWPRLVSALDRHSTAPRISWLANPSRILFIFVVCYFTDLISCSHRH